MQIFKFGGASVKSAEAIKNVARIVKLQPQDSFIVVVSAMGKTTNALELVWEYYVAQNLTDALSKLDEIEQYHLSIWRELMPQQTSSPDFSAYFEQIRRFLDKPTPLDLNFGYDQIIACGELISSALLSAYLNSVELTNVWLDAGSIIKTDNTYREGKVNWEESQMAANQFKIELQERGEHSLTITQGFIGKTPENFLCTLGREGSDFTAAIFAWLFDAEKVTIWKDVPGMLNADPKYFPNTVKLDALSYREAIELAYYGASVIHPKTIKPLQNKEIKLYIKSFFNPELPGSVICSEAEASPNVPCYIFKEHQILISISPKDFSFVIEENLRDIFDKLTQFGVRVHLMQNSAVSFSIVATETPQVFECIKALKETYRVLYNLNCKLLTVRHYNEAILKELTDPYQILVEQKNRQTVRLVLLAKD
ncbi:MAG: aspartate kinase [Luteibaculaceae bacterium]